jgi:hypothetical protein
MRSIRDMRLGEGREREERNRSSSARFSKYLLVEMGGASG